MKPKRTLVVLAWLADNPGATARDVAEMLACRAPTHSEHTTAAAVLRSLADSGDVERVPGSYPQQWRVAESLMPPLVRPEYVDVVIARLAKLRKLAPERCYHLIDYCMVDLGRALGRVPLLDNED